MSTILDAFGRTEDDYVHRAICPLKDAMERNNRKPLGFSIADTYFDMDLDESFISPKGAHMVRPSSASFKEGVFNFLSKKEHTATVSKTQKTPAIKAPLLREGSCQNR